MSGFSSAWLALRAGADERARSLDLATMAARALEGKGAGPSAPLIVDLGAGTGATLRALAPHLPRPQEWLLIDDDPALLAIAAERTQDLKGVSATPLRADLCAARWPWTTPPALVTASALFDLTSRAWMDSLAQRLAEDGAMLAAALTYDGRLAVTPGHPDDAFMVDAFNAHQRGDKGFGLAAGPEASAALVEAFATRGFRVIERRSDWNLERGRDGALIDATLTGWADAARELYPDEAQRIGAWRAARVGRAERLTVGHRDHLALPPCAPDGRRNSRDLR